MVVTLIIFLLILGLLVLIHEFGHFITAKRAGIKVEEFAFGFPPRIWSIKKGETEYSLNLLPFGGYVKMLGEDEDASASEKKNERSFAHQSVWTRAKVVVAGVVMNFLLGWLLISLGFMIGMPPIASKPETIPYAQTKDAVVITAIGRPSAAETMGIKPGDSVVSFNGQAIKTREELAALTKGNKGQNVTLEVTRNGQTRTVSGQLGQGEGPLGVVLDTLTTAKLPIWWAPIYGLWEAIKATGLIFVGIMKFFQQLIGSQQIPAEAAGPVGIFYITRSILDLGVAALINFVAVLSINLAVINILPIPALDGGRLLFILLEKFNRGKKVINQQIENIAHTVGFILLILLILTITYNDILKLG